MRNTALKDDGMVSAKHTENLVICVGEPHLEDLPEPDKTKVIALKWETFLALEKSGFSVEAHLVENPEEALSSALMEADELWVNHLIATSNMASHLNSAFSFYALLHCTLSRQTIEAALDSWNFEKLWVPNEIREKTQEFCISYGNEYSDFLNNWIWAALRDEIENRSVAFTTFRTLSRPRAVKLGNSVLSGISRDGQLIEKLAYRINESRHKLGRLRTTQEPSKSLPLESRSEVLILAQKPKVWMLTSLLKAAGVAFTHYEDIPVSPPSPQLSKIHYGSAREAMREYLHLRDMRLSQYEDAVQSLAAQNWSCLITDHEYDAKTRLLIDEFTKLGKPVALIPEGSQPRTSETWPMTRNWHYDHASATRFILSQAESKFYDERSFRGPRVISGYFGNTFRYQRLLRPLRFMRTIWSQAWRPRVRKTRLLISLEIYENTPGYTGIHDYCKSAELLDLLSLSDKYVIRAKVRHSHTLGLLRLRFPRVRFYGLIPWQLLAELSDVVVHSDSSLGLEALQLGKPVLTYKTHLGPGYSDLWGRQESDVVRVVERLSEIEEALSELMISPKKDFDRYGAFLAQKQDRVVNWILQQRQYSDKALVTR